MKIRIALLAAAVGALATAGLALGSNQNKPTQPGGQSAQKTTICHRTHSARKPYVRMTVSNRALAAHTRHSTDIIPAPQTCPSQVMTPLRGGRKLSASLNGLNGGDPDGTGTAQLRLNPGQATVCFRLQVSNIMLPALAAHIHRGSDSSIVVNLTAPDASGTAQGCTQGVARALVKEIMKNPGAFYVNVHTTDFPAGAVRGDLSK